MSEIRAGTVQDFLAAADVLGAGASSRVRERLGGDLERIVSATRIAWLPVPVQAALFEAVHAEAGPIATREWAREAMLRAARSRLVSPFLTLATHAVSPASFLARGPLVWKAIHRRCGFVTVHQLAAEEIELRFIALPDGFRTPAGLAALAGTVEAAAALCRRPASVEVGATATTVHVAVRFARKPVKAA